MGRGRVGVGGLGAHRAGKVHAEFGELLQDAAMPLGPIRGGIGRRGVRGWACIEHEQNENMEIGRSQEI